MRAVPSILLVSILSFGCSDSPTGPSDDGRNPSLERPLPVSFRVAPATASLQYGQTIQLTTTFTGAAALASGRGAVAWQSSNENVASVSDRGLVQGVSGGQTRITATWGEYQASATIIVSGPRKKQEEPGACLKRIPETERILSPQC